MPQTSQPVRSITANSSFTAKSYNQQQQQNPNLQPNLNLQQNSTSPTSPTSLPNEPQYQATTNLSTPKQQYDQFDDGQYSFEYDIANYDEAVKNSEECLVNEIQTNNSGGIYDAAGYIMNMPGAGVAGIGSGNDDRRRSVTPPLRSVRREDGDRRFNTGYASGLKKNGWNGGNCVKNKANEENVKKTWKNEK